MSKVVEKSVVANAILGRINQVISNVQEIPNAYTNPTERIREIDQIVTWLYADNALTVFDLRLLANAIRGAYKELAHRVE